MHSESPQLASLLDHQDLGRVDRETKTLLKNWYGSDLLKTIHHLFNETVRVFQGRMKGYRACNTGYHNLQHTVDVFVATVRLIDGFHLSGTDISPETAQDLCTAALLHDVGYILETSDTEGTGAKYTRTHVRRGVEFLIRHHKDWDIPADRTPSISRMIYGTDLALDWHGLGFSSSEEATAGAILATADLLGQMADRAYLEKLLFLYYEFKEAGFENYKTEFDILKSTHRFYTDTQIRLDTVLDKAYEKALPHFLTRYGIARNLYMESIGRQMAYLQSIMDDATTNFRKKLKRLDLERPEMAPRN